MIKTTKIRLHKAINKHINQLGLDYTSPEIQRNIAQYGVYVDEELVYNRLFWVYEGHSLGVSHWPQRDHGDFGSIKIIHESSDLIVVYKPTGIVVQPGSGHKKHNLITWLKKLYPDICRFDTDKYPSSGLINRIDKDTQGIVLVARNEHALKFYQDQFRNRQVIKEYFSLVRGVVISGYHVKAWQCRDKANPTRQKLFWTEREAKIYDPEARCSESIIYPQWVCRDTCQSIIKVRIKTGRMHQIRLHCESLGIPLENDKVYHKNIDSRTLLNYEQKNEKFEEGWCIDLKVSPQELGKDDFLHFKLDLFKVPDYGLLSSYISLKDQKGNKMTFDINKEGVVGDTGIGI